MAAWLDNVKFNPTAGGTTDWTYSTAVQGYQSPAAAGVVNGTKYKYFAVSSDLSQWEIGEGTYTTATGVLTRATVLYNSSGTGAATGQSGTGTKINFTNPPLVAIVAIKEDLISVEEANSFTTAQQQRARSNAGLGNLKNLLRNGTFDIWQRGTAPAVSGTGLWIYTADGWSIDFNGAIGAVAQASNSRSGANTLFGLQLTGVTGCTDVLVKQRIESYLAARGAGKNVTLQAWLYNNTGASITPTIAVNRCTAQDNWGATAAELAATPLQACANGAWTQVSYTFALSASAGNGIELILEFGSVLGANTKSVIIAEGDLQATPSLATGLQSSPPLPEFRFVADELVLCQRYYFRKGGVVNLGLAQAESAANAFLMVPLPVPLRATPTLANLSSPAHFSALTASGSAFNAFSSNGSVGGDTSLFAVLLTGGSGLTAGSATVVEINTAAGFFEVGAEL